MGYIILREQIIYVIQIYGRSEIGRIEGNS